VLNSLFLVQENLLTIPILYLSRYIDSLDSQTVTDQYPTEVFSENVVKQVTSTALSNDIEGELLVGENPQPPATDFLNCIDEASAVAERK
jgi:hypothetical protein